MNPTPMRLILIGFCLLPIALFGQVSVMSFDYDRAYFDEGTPLPAHKHFMITGVASAVTDLVELHVHKNADTKRTPLFVGVWKRQESGGQAPFVIPVHLALRGSSEYTLVFHYYARISEEERLSLRSGVEQGLNAFVDQVISIDKKRFELSNSAGEMVSAMNEIVRSGLTFYRNRMDADFQGFSDIVKNSIDHIRSSKLKKAKHEITSEEASSKKDGRIEYARKQIEALKKQIRAELDGVMLTDLMKLVDVRQVLDYPTEEKIRTIGLSLGLAGVYGDGGARNLTYDASPFGAISLPLGHSAGSSSFMRNVSLNAGVLFQNLSINKETVTGPLVGRPWFVGAGYKVFHIIRLNAGAAALQVDNTTTERIFVRPYVGLSAEINLWLGLDPPR